MNYWMSKHLTLKRNKIRKSEEANAGTEALKTE